MKDNAKDCVKTQHLKITLYQDPSELSGAESFVKEDLTQLAASVKKEDPFGHLLLLCDNKTGRAVGAVQSFSTSHAQKAEISLRMYAAENGEKIAEEALKGAARWLFAAHRDLLMLETWLNPDLAAIRILEKAGFERVFEKDGVVRYERRRPHFPFLVAFMAAFAALGILFGFLFDNYPLCVAVGIAAGILPGALVERFAQKKREKKL